MKVLVVGSGGREHALVWKLGMSSSIERIYAAPGNAGTALEAKTVNVSIDPMDVDSLLLFADTEDIGLTVIGPEMPLVSGIVDKFQLSNRPCFGPTKNSAQLEGSKSFSKLFMERHDIPTAPFRIFNNSSEAIGYARTKKLPLVIKANGLAAGKGVIIAHTLHEAEETIHQILDEKRFGTAGDQVILEDFINGEEASFICIVSDDQILPLATSQDHKARNAGDTGPNTGGMGAYSPAPVITTTLFNRIMQDVIEPTVEGLAHEGISYKGFLYAGLMIDQYGQPHVLEYNCRAGDPETQPILLRLQSDLYELISSALAGELHKVSPKWDPRAALGVVMTAGGYPDRYKTGNVIEGLINIGGEDTQVFHAGTTNLGSNIVTNGGRVLCVTSLGRSVSDAQTTAYRYVNQIQWENAYFRPDIGYRAIAREANS
ncbi:MAG: phosphoribosylamine--glycine ligase [Acidiferrobacteraceae bacterium]|nr:phosphoribosylamine--glycine ligase [Acidiferrobacteraceae bacterium]|tara:strand:+ start:1657 stop:2946 length:1290 start_codon:yes stop_codon:yes gene_type:complete